MITRLFGKLNKSHLIRNFSAATNAGYKDYYQVLGVTNEATQEEIKEAYKAKANELHPDFNNQGSTLSDSEAITRFQDLAEAFAVLSDPSKRKQFEADNKNRPEILLNKIRKVKQTRAKDGSQDGTSVYDVNEYGRKFKEDLKKERAKFNVSQFSTYKGGVPKYGAGRIRGEAWKEPGGFHYGLEHDDVRRPFNSELNVEQSREQGFNHAMLSKRNLILRQGNGRETRRREWIGED